MKSKFLVPLKKFSEGNKFSGKGAYTVGLVVTEFARKELPLDPNKLKTKNRGQVSGLSGQAAEKILLRHGIKRPISSEGARTNRGAMGQMETYVAFLNSLAPLTQGDLDEIQKYWVDRIEEYFASKPLKLQVNTSTSIRFAVRHLLEQARKRQKDYPGVRYEAALLQHLVGAKLELVLSPGAVIHHGASEADMADGRAGDFQIEDVAIHVTTAPSEKLVNKCAANITAGLQPLIITLQTKTAAADELADNAGIQSRVDILDIEQFLTANLLERSRFKSADRKPTTEALVQKYNELIAAHESDTSLKIET